MRIIFLGVVYYSMENYEQSIELYDKCIQINPIAYLYYLNKGISLFYLKRYIEVIKVLNIGLILHGDSII